MLSLENKNGFKTLYFDYHINSSIMEEQKEEQILVNRLSLIFLSLQTANSLMTEIDERYNRKKCQVKEKCQ